MSVSTVKKKKNKKIKKEELTVSKEETQRQGNNTKRFSRFEETVNMIAQ
jgi:hypothetical protein